MKQNNLIKRLSLLLTLALTVLTVFAAVGCSFLTPKLNGFDIKAEMQVKHNSVASAQDLFVTDDDGAIYDVSITVLDSNEKKVQTDEGNTFIATDENGYTIIYTIATFDFTLEKRTKVVVVDGEPETKDELTDGTLTNNVTGALTDDYLYDVTIEIEGKGKCYSTLEQVPFGGMVEFSIKPDLNYRVKSFTVNGRDVTVTGTAHNEYCVTEDIHVKVVFEYVVITVSFVVDGVDVQVRDKLTKKNDYYGFMPDLRRISDLPEEGDNDFNHYYCLADNQVFVGWYTEPNGQGKLINGGCYTPATNHTLYAYIKTVA